MNIHNPLSDSLLTSINNPPCIAMWMIFYKNNKIDKRIIYNQGNNPACVRWIEEIKDNNPDESWTGREFAMIKIHDKKIVYDEGYIFRAPLTYKERE